MSETSFRWDYWEDWLQHPPRVLPDGSLACEWECHTSYCGQPRQCIIYGLYDERTADIFYVGKTLDMSRRFADHLRNHWYIYFMLERGYYPLPIILCEFPTWCDQYARAIEHDIAQQLRAQGHSAYGDTTCTDIGYMYKNGERVSRRKRGIGYDEFYLLVEEQAQQVAALRAMWTA